MRGPLLRTQALEQVNAADDVDRAMHLMRPAAWLALLALVAVVASAVGWGLLGRISTQVPAQSGILLKKDSLNSVVSPGAGVVSRVVVSEGDSVTRGQVVASLAGRDGSTPVRSYVAGTVAEVVVAAGAPVDSGEQVAVVQRGNEPLQAVLYVSQDDGESLQEGTPAFVSPATVAAEEYGYLLGRVASVSELPPSPEQMMLVLANEELVEELRGGGDRLQVVVDLTRDASTPSGFAWSIDDGPPYELSNVTLATGTFVTGQERPAELVLPSER